ncbi:hypothetical protein ACIBLA_05210 [Streptomyces sp. NPDC050433]|uniref:hypothetical protein n=1 Tax=Streptomyces sp. NPDC050433 TaxID=3365615 RepID=UPI00379C744D
MHSPLSDALTNQLQQRGMQVSQVRPDDLRHPVVHRAQHCYVLENGLPEHQPGASAALVGAAVSWVLTTGASTGVSRMTVATSSPRATAQAEEVLSGAADTGTEVRRAVLGHIVPSRPYLTKDSAAPGPGDWLTGLLRTLLRGPRREAVRLDASQAHNFALIGAGEAAAGLYRLMRSNHREPLLLADGAGPQVTAFLARLTSLSGTQVLAGPQAPVRIPPLASAASGTAAALGWSPGQDGSADALLASVLSAG